MKKFITTTLPYANAAPHIGHTFEFVLADVIADYWRAKLGKENVRLNIGLDEHGQKIWQKAQQLGKDPQTYCDETAAEWKRFCDLLEITYDYFYRTSDQQHKESALRFTEELAEFIYERDYEGLYCVGCESYKTSKEVVNGRCAIHGYELSPTKERVKCFDLKRFSDSIEDRLVDKTLSNELRNIIDSDFDFPITRKNVEWAIPFEDGTLHCWHEALCNYIFAAGYYRGDEFKQWWPNTLQLCGKDNLKFQAYIFQAMLLAAGVEQTSEILVHGIILDEKGTKMSKSLGNVIDPVTQIEKYGAQALRYYLTLGLSTYGDSAFSEKELVNQWNNEIVGGFGNLIARTLHLVDIQNVDLDLEFVKNIKSGVYWHEVNNAKSKAIQNAFERYDFHAVRELLCSWVGELNKRINDERPFDPKVENRTYIIADIWKALSCIGDFYAILLKDDRIVPALKGGKKAILYQKLDVNKEVA